MCSRPYLVTVMTMTDSTMNTNLVKFQFKFQLCKLPEVEVVARGVWTVQSRRVHHRPR